MSTTGPFEAVRDQSEPELPAVYPAGAVPRPRAEGDGAGGGPSASPTEPGSGASAPIVEPGSGPSASPAEPGSGPSASPAEPAMRWGLGAYLLVEAVFLTVSVLLVLPWLGPEQKPPPPVLLLSLAVPTVLSAAVAVAVTWLRGNGPRIDLGLRFTRADLTLGLAFGCAGLLLTIPAAAVWSRVVGPDRASSAVAELFGGQRFPVPLAITVFLVVWLVAPVCEEIVYRGLLWRAMERHGATGWWAFGLTTLVFAVAHFEFTRTPLLLVISVPIGLARLYTGRLGASILAHQVNNLLPAVALLLLLLGVLPADPPSG